MLRFFSTALLCFVFMSSSVLAQQATDDGFCAAAPTEMMTALDGTWSLQQGAGFAVAGGIPIPLPPHPPQTINITVDQILGQAEFSLGDEEMIMVPTLPEYVQAALTDLNEAESEVLLDIGEGCDWYALPLMLGSNTYVLDASALEPTNGALTIIYDDTQYILCRSGVFMSWVPPFQVYDSVGVLGPDTPGLDDFCDSADLEIPAPGEMVMNLVVKFQSPNSGTGLLIFRGMQDGYAFGAKAPVKFSR